MYRTKNKVKKLNFSTNASSSASTEKKVMWLKTTTGLKVLGNITYTLQLGGFLCQDPLMMRSFLVGGSSVFVVYALIQPTALVVPALWEGAFAAIHVYNIYRLLNTENVTLTPAELKMYGMVFQRHALEVDEFQGLMKRGEWIDMKDGDKLTTYNQLNEWVWIIVKGDVVVSANDASNNKNDIKLKEGQFVGEVSLLKDFQNKGHEPTTASATCLCKGDVKCFRWSRKDLFDYLETSESSKKVVQSLFADVVDKFLQEHSTHKVKVKKALTNDA